MADWKIWVVIGVLGVATACTRSLLWMIGHRVTIPPRMREVLRYAPACALAAVVGPDLAFGAHGELDLGLDNPKLLAGVAALAYYLWRRSMLQTIVFGMLVLTAVRLAHGAG